MKINLITSILIICCVQLYAQKQKLNKFWHSKYAYFGQHPPDEIPKIFAPNMLIDSGIVLGTVSFSNDGKTFYYTHAKGWFNSDGSQTQQKQFVNGKWQKPSILFDHVVNPTISSDNKTMYYGGNGSKVSVSHLNSGIWTSPIVLHDKVYGLYNWMPTYDPITFYVSSNALSGSKGDYSTYDFCKMVVTATDTTIESLGQPLNTPAFDGDFYIAPDESYMVISTKETATYECELWISFRKKDKSWSEPQSLGNQINNGSAHRFGQYVTPDGKYLIYTKGTSDKDCNFYWVRFDGLMNRLKKEARL